MAILAAILDFISQIAQGVELHPLDITMGIL